MTGRNAISRNGNDRAFTIVRTIVPDRVKVPDKVHIGNKMPAYERHNEKCMYEIPDLHADSIGASKPACQNCGESRQAAQPALLARVKIDCARRTEIIITDTLLMLTGY